MEVLARRQLLVVLDNYEHVLAAAAELCAALLPLADDIQVLAPRQQSLTATVEWSYQLLGLPQLTEVVPVQMRPAAGFRPGWSRLRRCLPAWAGADSGARPVRLSRP